MPHKTFYILSNGTVLRRAGKRLILERQGEKFYECPLKDVGRILIYASTEITGQTLSALMDEQIPLYFVKRSGELKGKIMPASNTQIQLRVLQHRSFSDDAFSLPLAKSFIYTKLQNMKEILIYLYQNSRGTQEVCQPIQNASERLAPCQNREEIMGIEGAAARHYFQIIGSKLPEPFRFTQRSRRPALDPTNALLNLGYMTLLREVQAHIEAHHLDSYLGLLHAIQDGRASLALDMMEEFRQPFIDLFVMKAIQRGSIKPEHFVKKEDTLHITQEGMDRFFRLYEEKMGMQDGEEPGLRKLIDDQVHSLKKHLLGEDTYKNFQIEFCGQENDG